MFRRAVYALACVLALTLPVAAQEQTGQIQGSVKDSSGAVLPGVTVEITNTSTGSVAATVVTDANGIYRVPGLRPGSTKRSPSCRASRRPRPRTSSFALARS